jgi:hypothetical protein
VYLTEPLRRRCVERVGFRLGTIVQSGIRHRGIGVAREPKRALERRVEAPVRDCVATSLSCLEVFTLLLNTFTLHVVAAGACGRLFDRRQHGAQHRTRCAVFARRPKA